MTRINCVPVDTLTNKHLIAEYKEITRPFNKVISRIEKFGYEKALADCDIPEKYTLGKGHETFFFNKLGWLHKRYLDLALEMETRGFSVDFDKRSEISEVFKSKLMTSPVEASMVSKFWRSWNPSPEDMYLNMARLVIRSDVDEAKEEIVKKG